MILICDGVIGSGKTTLTKILSEKLGTKPFYEPVGDNPILPLFYKGNKLVEEGKAETNPYAFLLQIYFLNKRFGMIKEAMQEDNNILDRAIYCDSLFMKMNVDQGHATKEEWEVYKDLFNNMMEELPLAAHKKSPDLLIYIDVSLETMLKRIRKRGRKFEQVDKDPSLIQYYKDLLHYYKEWYDSYDASKKIKIDGDKYDFVTSEKDKSEVLKIIYNALYVSKNIDVKTFHKLCLEEDI